MELDTITRARKALDAMPVETQGRSLHVSATMARRLGFTEAQIESAMSIDGCYLQDGSLLFVWIE